MSHTLVYARSRSQLERARIFLESSTIQGATYDYIFFHRGEDEKPGYRYDANIDRLLHRASYSAIIFWGIPREFRYIKNTPYFIVFENADHILYPRHNKTFILLAWWRELQQKQWMKYARATLSLHPYIRQHLCDELKGNIQNHYCLPAHLPPILQEQDAKLERSFFEFRPDTVCIVGNDYLHTNIAECLEITNGDITFFVLSSDQNATTHLFRQIHIWEQANKESLKDGEVANIPRIVRDQDAIVRTSQPNHFIGGVILLDLHLTSGISDTLAYALEIGAPIITLNKNSLSQELRNIEYPYIFSLARTNEIKASLEELRTNHQTYTIAREAIEEYGRLCKKNTSRSSEHMHFLLEKPPESKRNEKIM